MMMASTTVIPAEQHITKNRIAPTTLRTRRARPTLRLELQKVLQRGGVVPVVVMEKVLANRVEKVAPKERVEKVAPKERVEKLTKKTRKAIQ